MIIKKGKKVTIYWSSNPQDRGLYELLSEFDTNVDKFIHVEYMKDGKGDKKNTLYPSNAIFAMEW